MQKDTIAQPAEIRLEKISKVYPSPKGPVTAVEESDLYIKPGEFVTFLGPSGCGKTTTLRLLAGFETPTTGTIRLNGKDITAMPTNKRPMSMVFQSYALFPHLSVRKNVSFGLDLTKMDKSEKEQRVKRAMEAMHIAEYADRAPNQLSGGQQQRVALARALVMEPQVLLFDEPLSNLDAKLRAFMRVEIRRIQQEFRITSIFVTHDQDEAMMMSDTIVVMSRGRIEQIGSPSEVYRRPNSVFVAEFLGTANFIPATVKAPAEDGLVTIQTEDGVYQVPGPAGLKPEQKVKLLLRAENLQLDQPRSEAGKMVLSGTIRNVIFHGESVEYELETPGGIRLLIRVSGMADFKTVGENVVCWVDLQQVWAVPQDKAGDN